MADPNVCGVCQMELRVAALSTGYNRDSRLPSLPSKARSHQNSLARRGLLSRITRLATVSRPAAGTVAGSNWTHLYQLPPRLLTMTR